MQFKIENSLGLTNVNLDQLLTNYKPTAVVTPSTEFSLDPQAQTTLQKQLFSLWSSIINPAQVFNIKLLKCTVVNYFDVSDYLILNKNTSFSLDYTIFLDPRIYPNMSVIYDCLNKVNNSLYNQKLYENITTQVNPSSLVNTVPLNLRFPKATCKKEFFIFNLAHLLR